MTKCPNCGKEQDIGIRGKMLRKILLSPSPLLSLLPPKDKHLEQWCGDCLRKYVEFDRIDMLKTAQFGQIYYKEK